MKLSYFSSLCLSLFVLKPLFLIMQEYMFSPPPLYLPRVVSLKTMSNLTQGRPTLHSHYYTF